MNPTKAERFRPFGPGSFVRHGLSILCVVLLLLFWLQLLSPYHGDVGAWVRSFGGRPLGLVVGWTPYLSIPLLLLAPFDLADAILTVLEITEGGIAWKRWGRTRWFIPWSDYAGWRWEQRPGERAPRALLLLEGTGESPRTRRVSVQWRPIDAAPFYKAILAALTEHAPEKGERP